MNLIGSNVLVSLATTNEVNQNTVTWILVQIKISVARTVKKISLGNKEEGTFSNTKTPESFTETSG